MKRSEMLKSIRSTLYSYEPLSRKRNDVTQLANLILEDIEREGMLPPKDYKNDRFHYNDVLNHKWEDE